MTTQREPDRVVIVGAGLAGASVAVSLREEGFAGSIALLGAEVTPPFGRPPLSKTYLLGKESVADWYVKPVGWYDENQVDLRPDAAVEHVDTRAALVVLASGEAVGYDRLVLCTGGRARRLEIPGAALVGVHTLRTVADCEAIKVAAQPGSRTVVIGMGFIGSEVAAALRELDVAVTVLMTGSTPLETTLGADIGAAMASIHREHGVDLVPRDRVVRFEGSTHLERVVTRKGAELECDFAVVGAGIEPNVALVAGTPIALDNGVLVDANCRTNVEGVYAAGDVANHLHPLFGRVRVEHYNNAERMGRAVGRSLVGNEAPYGYVHSFWSDQYEHKLEYVGHALSWDRFVVRGSVEGREFVGLYIRDGMLAAAVGLNRGGDPELDENSELHACQELIARRALVPVDGLADERTCLVDLL
jgi:3-phenylpropionate/trans-cinnamate dioxygenase ferredoxin reductase subunit